MESARRLLLLLEDNVPNVNPPISDGLITDNFMNLQTDNDQFIIID